MAKEETATAPTPAPEVPAGFTKADTDVDNYPAWDFEADGDLTGLVRKVKTVELMRRGEPVDVRMAVVQLDDGGRCCLWESANLDDFFDSIRADSRILVQLVGTQELKGNRSMKLYNAYYR